MDPRPGSHSLTPTAGLDELVRKFESSALTQLALRSCARREKLSHAILDSPYGGVAQLVRAPACHAGGRGFEPRRSRSLIRPGWGSLPVVRRRFEPITAC